ncbi:UPF0505 protein C16orf62-like [Quillaja saponaria]|uniref:UPF0505 protein C16orf62-like n=1 Tax=Quillaja saponaria TaxID=32244 RepID=A0AAD7LT01_QUISA|nr:UPF0505 protein C16orf62-like [Quillaja saponaria]
MEFRPRNYRAEQESHELSRVATDSHPLCYPSLSHTEVHVVDDRNNDFFDPLRGTASNAEVSGKNLQDVDDIPVPELSSEAGNQLPNKESTPFRRLLMQRFPVSKMISISSMSEIIVKGGKKFEKSLTSKHLEELDDPQKFADEDKKVITRQEYVSRIHDLKDEIRHAWIAGDRVTSLKLSIKVARLLTDTSVLHFYPTLFVLATDIMDMLGNMVWERIKRKAEYSEDGNLLYFLPENFEASDICSDAKETCNNWFCKIGAVQELLPRIYLELAILPCWRFLLDQPVDSLQRLVRMTRGLADPVAFVYCHLYMAHCAQKLPSRDIGYLVTCVNDIRVLLTRIVSTDESAHGNTTENKRLLVSLMEPAIEYIMKCIFKDLSQRQVMNVLAELGLRRDKQLFGRFSCVSILVHHLLKELPTEVVCSNAVEIFHLIECNNDCSFNQHMNYRLLGFRLYESRFQVDVVNVVVDKAIQVISQYDSLDEYLKVVDAYMELVLQHLMDKHLNTILEGISERAWNKGINEDELASLQSILLKLLSFFKCLEDVFALDHFRKILDVMYGNSRIDVNMNILDLATRNGPICNPTTIQLVFEISQALYDTLDFMNVTDGASQAASLITRFVIMVDYGAEMECHLAFLVDCRGAFSSINNLKETLVHSSNCLAFKALKDTKRHMSFFKSCITFSEVTIPSIFALSRQLNLYIETAEVALVGGLVSHSDGLIDSSVSCLQSLDKTDGSRTQIDVDGIVSSIRKLCGLLVMVPGNPDLGVTYIPNTLLSLINSQPWMTPRKRSQSFCSIILLLATLSQDKLPYHADNVEILDNAIIYFGDASYGNDLVSLSKFVLQNLLSAIQQETSQAARGVMALEACNCIASSFVLNHEILPICLTLIETAKSCLAARDKYLQSTINFFDRQLPTSPVALPSCS